jgi:hypothetical protein
MGAINTGVFATPDEVTEAKRRSVEVRDTPVVKVHGEWLHDAALESFQAWLDGLAVAHGLPAPERDADGDVIHYGLAGTGEFTKWDGQP